MFYNSKQKSTVHKPVFVTGVSLFVMAALAGYANFGVLEANGSPKIAAILFSIVILLDIIVALGLHMIFRVVNNKLSLAATAFRLMYAAIFAAAVGYLFSDNISLFNKVWQAGLFLFAFHLVFVGVLLARAKFAPTWLAVLLVIAGAGYAVDSVGTFAVNNYALNVAGVTFIGEVVLIFWLFYLAFKSRPSTE